MLYERNRSGERIYRGAIATPGETVRGAQRKMVVLTDKCMKQAWICLHCTKEVCDGEEKCFREEMRKRESEAKSEYHIPARQRRNAACNT